MIDTTNIDAKKVVRFLEKLADNPDHRVSLFSYQHFNKYHGVSGKTNLEATSKHGIILNFSDRAVIYLNEKQPPDQLIYTMAHEVGHLILGHLSYNQVDKNIQEWEAELFASAITFVINGAIPYMKYYSRQ